MAGTVSGDRSRTKEFLPFIDARRVWCLVRKEFNAEGGVGGAVQSPLHCGRAPGDGGGSYGRPILQVVGPGVPVAHIVNGYAIRTQVDPYAPVAKNGVAPDGIIVGGTVDCASNADADLAVSHDEITDSVTVAAGRRARVDPTDGIARGPVEAECITDGYSIKIVAQGYGAGDIGADVISLHHVAAGVAKYANTAKAIARDNISGFGRAPPHGVVGRGENANPVLVIP